MPAQPEPLDYDATYVAIAAAVVALHAYGQSDRAQQLVKLAQALNDGAKSTERTDLLLRVTVEPAQ